MTSAGLFVHSTVSCLFDQRSALNKTCKSEDKYSVGVRRLLLVAEPVLTQVAEMGGVVDHVATAMAMTTKVTTTVVMSTKVTTRRRKIAEITAVCPMACSAVQPVCLDIIVKA